MRPRIALFTPFSPDLGGGSVVLKSVLPELHGLEVEWYYLAPSEAQSIKSHWIGRPLTPGSLIKDLLARTRFLPGSIAAVGEIVGQIEADLYWVVAHNEGVLVAAELLASGKRVHLTVHDDPGATFSMSRKYRCLQPLMSLVFGRVLKAAESVDVISAAMLEIYKLNYKIDGIAFSRYLPSLPTLTITPEEGILRVGHIGTLYHPEPFRRFVQSCKAYAAKTSRKLRIARIGKSKFIDQVAAKNPDLFEDAGELSELEAIKVLASCNFVYAMYPSGSRFKLFRRTSFPVKFSTYIQSQRPIFAHTPTDSTLASAIATFQIGQVCSSNLPAEIEDSIEKILNQRPGTASFEAVRRDLFDLPQVQSIKTALSRLA